MLFGLSFFHIVHNQFSKRREALLFDNAVCITWLKPIEYPCIVYACRCFLQTLKPSRGLEDVPASLDFGQVYELGRINHSALPINK